MSGRCAKVFTEMSDRKVSNLGIDVRTILEYASRYVPAYKGIRVVDLMSFPIAAKSDFRRHPGNFISDDFSSAVRERLLVALEAQMEQESLSVTVLERQFGDIYLERSSGTTGPGMWLPKTRQERVSLSFLLAKTRRKRYANFNPNRFCNINPILSDPARALSVQQPVAIAGLFGELAARGIDHLYGHAGLMAFHAARLLATSFRPHFDVVELSGQALNEEELSCIATVFSPTIILDQFGCCETSAIAYRDAGDNSFDLLPSVSAEILDEAGSPIIEDCRYGALAVTSTILKFFPIIRFLTGDRVCWITQGASRRIRLEQERVRSKIRTVDQQLISGNSLMKALIQGNDTRSAHIVAGSWKVRKLGDTFTVYLCEADIHLAADLQCRFQRQVSIIGQHKLTFKIWAGWAPLEKRIPYIEYDESGSALEAT